MNFSTKIVKTISKYFAIAPQRRNQSTPKHKIASSKLKAVLKELSQSDLENFIWLSTLKPNSHFSSRTVSILRNTSIPNAQKTLDKLSDRNLIIQEGEDKYRLHESLRVFSEQLLTSKNSQDFSIKRLGIQWADAHQKIILELQKNHDHGGIRSNDYFLENILWHIHEAGWTSRIHSIISSLFPLNQWQEQINPLTIQENLGMSALLSEAERNAKDNFSEDQSQSLIRLSKYALMRSTQRLLLEAIPEQWVKRLLKAQKWSSTQGINYILNQNNTARKANSIDLLAACLIPEHTEFLLAEIEKLTTDFAKATAIKGLFGLLEVREKKIALNLIQTIQQESYQALCISHIAPHIPLTLMQQTYSIIANIKDETEQAKALSPFLKFCTKPLKKQCLNLVWGYQDLKQKVRLFHQLKATFPELETELISITQNIPLDYILASMLWSLIDPQKRTVETTIHWLSGKMSALDKVLFFNERISEANEQELKELWSLVSNQTQWAQTIGVQSATQNESNWANAVIGCISFLNSAHIQDLLQEVKALQSVEIQGELCLQLLPFVETPEQFDQIYQMLQNIPAIDDRLKILSQALDYIPQAQEQIRKALPQLTDTISHLEVQICLLEREPDIAPFFLQRLNELNDEIFKFHFLRQTLDLIPSKHMPDAIEIILSLSTFEHRNELLNIIEKRLTDDEIIQLIPQLNTLTYPRQLFKDAAKQIYRLYWESGTQHVTTELSQTLLSQLPCSAEHQASLTPEILNEIIGMSQTVNQSKVLSLYLPEIDWQSLDNQQFLAIMEILSNGIPEQFIKTFPLITQGITKRLGFESLPNYGNLCEQLGEIPSGNNAATNRKNILNTYHRCESPELLPKTA